MHRITDPLKTVVHVGEIAGKKLNKIGLFTIKNLESLPIYTFKLIRRELRISSKATNSLIEHAAIYTNNTAAKEYCKEQPKIFKLYHYYLNNETAFCNLQQRGKTFRKRR